MNPAYLPIPVLCRFLLYIGYSIFRFSNQFICMPFSSLPPVWLTAAYLYACQLPVYMTFCTLPV